MAADFRGGDADFDLLRSYLPAAPSAAERELAQRVREFVVARGVRLPSLTIEWFSTADPTLPRGFCTSPQEPEPVTVRLRVGLPRRELIRTALHEFAHARDHRHRALRVQQLEDRAERITRLWFDPACTELLGAR